MRDDRAYMMFRERRGRLSWLLTLFVGEPRLPGERLSSFTRHDGPIPPSAPPFAEPKLSTNVVEKSEYGKCMTRDGWGGMYH